MVNAGNRPDGRGTTPGGHNNRIEGPVFAGVSASTGVFNLTVTFNSASCLRKYLRVSANSSLPGMRTDRFSCPPIRSWPVEKGHPVAPCGRGDGKGEAGRAGAHDGNAFGPNRSGT